MLLRLLFCGLGLVSAQSVQYGNNQLPADKDNNAIAANFPKPDVDLLSPAFQNPERIPAGFTNGTAGPTSESELDYFLQKLAARNDWMSYVKPEFQSEEGRALPYVFLSQSSQKSVTPNSGKKVRVWLQGGVHGNEPAGDQSMLALLGKLDADQKWTASLLERLDIMILPRYNPDGVYYFQRTFATNIDPNRDHIKLSQQQTRNIKRLFSSFSPHVAVDMHEYRASRRYGGDYRHSTDGQFSAAKNLNINSKIRKMAEEVFAKRMASALEEADFRWAPYVTGEPSSKSGSPITFAEAGTDGRIGRNALGLTQCITFLCEGRGITLADQEFARRTTASLVMAEAIVQTAADRAEDVYATVESGIKEFTDSQDEIIVTDSSETVVRDWPFVEIDTGKLVQVPINFTSTTPAIANLTRPRPEAYIIPKAWTELAERLRISGLEVQTLDYVFRGEVDTLNITSAKFADEYSEDVLPVTVTTEPVTAKVKLPVGSYLVPTRQKNAALAYIALEPENIDSYVSAGIIQVAVGDIYPVFRLMAS